MSAKRHIINRVNAVMDSTLNCPIIFQSCATRKERRRVYIRGEIVGDTTESRGGGEGGCDSNNNY